MFELDYSRYVEKYWKNNRLPNLFDRSFNFCVQYCPSWIGRSIDDSFCANNLASEKRWISGKVQFCYGSRYLRILLIVFKSFLCWNINYYTFDSVVIKKFSTLVSLVRICHRQRSHLFDQFFKFHIFQRLHTDLEFGLHDWQLILWSTWPEIMLWVCANTFFSRPNLISDFVQFEA